MPLIASTERVALRATTCTSAPLAMSNGSRRWATLPPPTTTTFFPASRRPARYGFSDAVTMTSGRRAGPVRRRCRRYNRLRRRRTSRPVRRRCRGYNRLRRRRTSRPQHGNVRNAVVEEVVTVSDESVLRVHVRQVYLSVDPARVVADFGQRRTQ